jgi:hypothetical protein
MTIEISSSVSSPAASRFRINFGNDRIGLSYITTSFDGSVTMARMGLPA